MWVNLLEGEGIGLLNLLEGEGIGQFFNLLEGEGIGLVNLLGGVEVYSKSPACWL